MGMTYTVEKSGIQISEHETYGGAATRLLKEVNDVLKHNPRQISESVTYAMVAVEGEDRNIISIMTVWE